MANASRFLSFHEPSHLSEGSGSLLMHSGEFWTSKPELFLITDSRLQFKVKTVKHSDVALNYLFHECRFNHRAVQMSEREHTPLCVVRLCVKNRCDSKNDSFSNGVRMTSDERPEQT